MAPSARAAAWAAVLVVVWVKQQAAVTRVKKAVPVVFIKWVLKAAKCQPVNRHETAQVRLLDLARVEGDVVDLLTLKQAGLIPGSAGGAKVFLKGELSRKLTLRGVGVTSGARAAIEAAGGTIEAQVEAQQAE